MGQPKFAKEIEESERTAAIKKTIHKNKIETESKQYLTKEIYQRTFNENEILKEENKKLNKYKEDLKIYVLLVIALSVISIIFAICLIYRIENWWGFIIGIIIGWFLPKK